MSETTRGLADRLREAAGDEQAFVLVDPDDLRKAAAALYTATVVRGAFSSLDGAPCWHNDCQCCTGWVEKIKEDRAALDAAGAPIPEAYACHRCGRRDGLDAVVPNEVWARISPTGNEGGLLCLWCIDAACAEAGISCSASLHFAGRAITGTSQSDADRDHVSRLCASLEASTERALDAVREAYGGDPDDPTWRTPEGIAGIIEELSALARVQAADKAAAMVGADRLCDALEEIRDSTDPGGNIHKIARRALSDHGGENGR